MTGFAGSVLRQSGENYLQRGQAFVQSRMSFMSTDSMHYYYNLNGEYGASLTRASIVNAFCCLGHNSTLIEL